jgi:galactonate dehydratase
MTPGKFSRRAGRTKEPSVSVRDRIVKITDIRCHVMGVPGPGGAGVLRNWIFVEVLTDEGLVGIGEATTEYHERAVQAQVETELKPRLLGMDPTEIERIWQLGYRDFWWRRGVVQTSAMSGIDMALWDITGKAAGLPVFKLLGGKVRERVRCYIRYGPEFAGVDRDTAARRATEMGFDAFKHGWGTATTPYNGDRQVEIAIAENARFREVLGPDAALMIETHLLDYPGRELYGRTMRLSFCEHLRGERRFESPDALTDQIKKDVDAARAWFKEHPPAQTQG